ncbi:hypothetical protein NDU88_006630 [Pleurodeles waltl]|uniref:Uncharacterized protein n=1 Tax=Pleurodeles waltl TaxID=8319 RepID=A0AAV7RQP3_PLEWA|nr:hypothetical protein NDU88_006630 [Pleurodeles waltl]
MPTSGQAGGAHIHSGSPMCRGSSVEKDEKAASRRLALPGTLPLPLSVLRCPRPTVVPRLTAFLSPGVGARSLPGASHQLVQGSFLI